MSKEQATPNSEPGNHTITIDGQTIPFQPGQSIMEAARNAGVYIHHLCYHPQYTPHGSCRLCTVRVNGRTAAACTTPCTNKQIIENHNDELTEYRRRLTEMLFIDGNHYCPSCERSGNCQLQATAYDLDMEEMDFHYLYPNRQIDASHDTVWLDRDRCILCELCVRASREADGKNVFSINGRGREAYLAVNSDSGLLKDSDLAPTDAAVHVCPVGAILVKEEGFQVPIGKRLYDEQPIRIVGNQRPQDRYSDAANPPPDPAIQDDSP